MEQSTTELHRSAPLEQTSFMRFAKAIVLSVIIFYGLLMVLIFFVVEPARLGYLFVGVTVVLIFWAIFDQYKEHRKKQGSIVEAMVQTLKDIRDWIFMSLIFSGGVITLLLIGRACSTGEF